MGAHTSKSSAMGGGGKSISEKVEQQTRNIRFYIPGVTGVDTPVKYTGTEEEISRADQITAVLIDNILSSNQVRDMASLIDHPYAMPATWADVRKQQMQVLKDNGYPETGAGYERFALERNGAYRFIINANTAKEVIEKYGGKVPANREMPRRIRVNQ